MEIRIITMKSDEMRHMKEPRSPPLNVQKLYIKDYWYTFPNELQTKSIDDCAGDGGEEFFTTGGGGVLS